MKKMLILLGLSICLHFQSSGDAWTVKRNWCGGFFHKKYQAYAKISTYWTKRYRTGYDASGRWVGYGPVATWYSVCDKSDKGCTRPRVAECNVSGYTYDQLWDGPYLFSSTYDDYNGYAKASYQTSGISLVQNTIDRTSAGIGGVYQLDQDKYNELNTKGQSSGVITGDIDVTDDGTLFIRNLAGHITISKSSDFYSKFKIIVIKEREDLSERDAARADSLENLGIFENVVYSGELSISKGKIIKTGVFENMDDSTLLSVDNDNEEGISFDNISAEEHLEIPMGKNEHLTLVTLVDGGFNMNSAILTNNQTMFQKTMLGADDHKKLSVFPNPVKNVVAFNVNAQADNSSIYVRCFDLLGRNMGNIYSGTLQKGLNRINNIDLSGLPAGAYIFQIAFEDKVLYEKIIKE